MEEEVLFSVNNEVGMITLNRPATLNALTMNMINKLRDKFTLSLIHISEPTRR